MAKKIFPGQPPGTVQLASQVASPLGASPLSGTVSLPIPPQPGTVPSTSHADKQGQFRFRPITRAKAHRIGIYGPGGIGKTSLACRAPAPVAVFDYDDSLDRLVLSLQGVRVRPITGVNSWDSQCDALRHMDIWRDVKTIVIDSATKAQELAAEHVLKTVRNARDQPVLSLEDYGYGKGFQYLYETFLGLLTVLDEHVRQGRNVILVMHEITASVPNPGGHDFLRWEPNLYHASSGKNSIRYRLREWCDHLFYLAYDLSVNSDGKAQGCGSRTVYPQELPTHMAKSRSLSQPIVYEQGSSLLWNQLFS